MIIFGHTPRMEEESKEHKWLVGAYSLHLKTRGNNYLDGFLRNIKILVVVLC